MQAWRIFSLVSRGHQAASLSFLGMRRAMWRAVPARFTPSGSTSPNHAISQANSFDSLFPLHTPHPPPLPIPTQGLSSLTGSRACRW